MPMIVIRTLFLFAAIHIWPIHAFSQHFALHGHIANLPDTTIYLTYNNRDGGEVTFEAIPDGGKFTFTGNLPEPTDAQLYTADESFVELVFIQPGTTRLWGDVSISKNVVMSGTPSAVELQDYNQATQEINNKKTMLLENHRQELYSKDTAIRQPLWRQFAEYSRLHDSITEDWILRHTNSYVAAMLCSYLYDDETETAKADSVIRFFGPAVQNSKYVKTLRELKDSYAKLAIGANAPDFELPDTKGKKVSPAQFKGKVLLLDFWGSWCGPCRKNNPELKKIYEQYHADGFEVLGIGLETDQKAWLKAIKDDGLPWVNVFAANEWNNPVARLYAIRAVPTALLIDASGKIAAKEVYADQLPKLLEKELSK